MRKIISSFKLNSQGLHSGKNCSVLIEPCESEFIIMRSKESGQELFVNQFKTSGTGRGSDYIFNDGEKLRTCEHVLSALFGLEIFSDAKLTVEGGEMPALDGCAYEISNEIIKNSKEINSKKNFLCVKIPVIVHDEKNKNRFVAYFPDYESQKLLITCAVDYEVAGSQLFDIECSSENFLNEISSARTFALYSDIEYLRNHGMALGGNLENAILIDNINGKIIASNGLKWHNEFVRHKILDLIGDLASLGRPLSGHIVAVRAGHALHLKLTEIIKNNI